ncbi:interleukin-8-like [Heterodontus francisci]|uniref:interleukin-8-like n=1 Tax=Heterodontus francisci TaxID=7792 RepID=UPI00355BE35D
MTSRVTLIFLTLFVLYMASPQVASFRSLGVNLRCQCIKRTTHFIHPKFMEHIEIVPSGAHCGNVEIIATVKSGNQVCLNSEAWWVQKIIEKLIKSSKKTEEVN